MSIFSTIFIKSSSTSYDQGLRQYMLGVYNYMSFGLFLTSFISFFAWKVNFAYIVATSPFGLVFSLAPIGLVFYLGSRITSMKLETAKSLFLAYSVCMGISLSVIFLMFHPILIIRAFSVTALTFGTMSIYGYITKADLSKFSSTITMLLFGIIISSLLNLFFKSSLIANILSLISVVLFSFLVSYDTQNIKRTYYAISSNGYDSSMSSKLAIFGALQLYMDFISIFIHLLHLFAAIKDNK